MNHKSGRLVIAVEPELKRALHAALAEDGMSLKDWLVAQAQAYIEARSRARGRPAPTTTRGAVE